MTLIAEDLLLLLLDDDTGTVQGSVELTPLLGGALLAELALMDAVRIGEKKGIWVPAKVQIAMADAPDLPPRDPLLAEAFQLVHEKDRSAQDLVGRLGKGVRDKLTTRLVEAGILERKESRILGIFPRTTWPAADRSHEEALRRDLTAVLVEGTEPDPRLGTIVALLVAAGRAHKTVPHPGVTDRDVKARAKAVAEGNWAAKAVKDAIDAVAAATMAAVTAAATAAAVGTGGS